jgi:hypothetical protein
VPAEFSLCLTHGPARIAKRSDLGGEPKVLERMKALRKDEHTFSS